MARKQNTTDPLAQRIKGLRDAFNRRFLHLGLAGDDAVMGLLAGLTDIERAVRELEHGVLRIDARVKALHDHLANGGTTI